MLGNEAATRAFTMIATSLIGPKRDVRQWVRGQPSTADEFKMLDRTSSPLRTALE